MNSTSRPRIRRRRFYWNLCLLIAAAVVALVAVVASPPFRRTFQPTWTQWRAAWGNPSAQLKLATMHAQGNGVARDEQEAMRCN